MAQRSNNTRKTIKKEPYLIWPGSGGGGMREGFDAPQEAICRIQPPVSDTAGCLRAAAGFSPQSGSPGGGLKATYRTPYEEPCAYELSAAEGVLLSSLFSHGF